MAENRFNFAQIEQELEMIIERFAENQNLLKLLYYNDKDALEKEDITDEKILNEILRQNIKIIPEVKIPERQNSFIIITFDSYEKNYSNPLLWIGLLVGLFLLAKIIYESLQKEK